MSSEGQTGRLGGHAAQATLPRAHPPPTRTRTPPRQGRVSCQRVSPCANSYAGDKECLRLAN